jgi:HAD superfamily hydrolase (TIGR01509 family)
MAKKALIFDLDETLVNSTALHTRVFNEVFGAYGIKKDTLPPELSKRFIGKRLVEINKEVIEHYHLSISVDALTKFRNEIVLTKIDSMQKLMPSAKYAISLGRKAGLRLAICSSGTADYVRKSLEKFNLQDSFDVIVTGDDVTKGKPDPECYTIAAKTLMVEPKYCVVIEDAANGVEAAKRAGMKAIAVINIHTPRQDLSKADLVLNSLKELKKEMIV